MSDSFNKKSRQPNPQKGFSASFMQGGGQNGALKWLQETQTPVCVFLITGVKFEGVINSFDQYTIGIVDIKGYQQLIYKDKISTLTLRKTTPSVSTMRSKLSRMTNSTEESEPKS